MKKDFLFLKKSRWLLFTLLALLTGSSPAWAQVTESFEDVTLIEPDSYSRSGELSNGWICVNSSGVQQSSGISQSANYYNYYFLSRGNNSSSKSFAGISSSSNSYYMIIPVYITGDVTFYMTGTADGSSTTGYLRFYKATDNGDGTYTIGSKIGSDFTKAGGSTTWVENTLSVGDEETMIAICMWRAAIDDFTYTPYVEAGCKKPTNVSVSNILFDSADLSWTAGEEGQDTWQVVYSTDANFDKDAATPINVNSTSYSFTGLNDNTTYYVGVRSYCGTEDQSKWVTTSFTTPLAPITSFPWSEDFSSISSGIPAGWDNTEGTTTSSSYKWTYYSSGHEGAGLRFNSYNNSSNNTNFLKTPAMNFPAGAAMQLKFWYKNPTGGDFSVYISNDGGATYATELATGLTAASSWTEKVIDIPSEFVNNVVIVFKGTSNYGNGDAYIYLDDVLVKENAAYAWSISGEDVTSNTIAFGEVKNSSTTKTFTISNDGANALTGVTVVSSDESAFTVSDTNFDIAAGATKDITVTFVKGVVGEYTKTITISQDNITDDIVLTVTGSYATPSVAEMSVKVGEEAVGETVAFGSVGKEKSKTITIANTGEADLVISSITSSNTTDFTVSPASLTVHGGSSETFTVTFVYPNEDPVLDAEMTANITVTASNEGIDPVVFAVTGTRIEQWSEDFSGTPDGWEITNSTYWKVEDGMAKGSYSYGNYDLVTPSLVVEAGQTMTFDYRLTSTYRSLDIQYSKNNGTWTNYGTISYSGLTLNQWYTYTIEGLEAGNYKFRFGDSNYDLDNFEGFKRNMNDPKLGIYSDAECTAAVATSVSQDFGFATETQTATYYIKNDGTGTMTLSLGDAPAGFTQSLDKTSVAAGEKATLTITMPAADNKGYHGGNVVVTATDLGTFTVAASGVIVDDTKMNLNFATDNIPSTWTTNSWSKNANGYAEVGYSSSPVTMQTSNLTAVAGEDLVVVAKQSYTTSSYSFGVKYKKTTDEEWSDLIPAANIGTSYVTLHGTIAEAGTYQLQFNGQYTQIQRIYGLTEPLEPVMVVYDGESVAAATYDFGYVSDETDATWTLTVKNEGQAELTGLAAALTGDNAAHYSVEVSATTVAVDGSATVTVKQLKENLGAHAATLTISATDLDSKVITLSGNTYDHTKLFVDFDNPNAIPTGWTAGTSWNVYTYGDDRYAQQTNYSTASALVTTPLTVAENETLTFQAARYSNYTAPEFKVRYTTDGGLTWSDYVDFASQITSSSYVDLELTDVPAGTVVVEFYGRYVKLDNIYGFTATTAPMLALTESSTAVVNGSTKEFGTLTAEATATYTLTNSGTADMVSTVATTGVATAAITGEGEGVTIADNKVTLAAGKSATITLTMPYAAPYGEKAGTMTITSEGWVGDIAVNYTATTVDPTALYIDFSDNEKPEGWYSNTWTYTSGYASAAYTATAVDMITAKLSVTGTDDVLSYEASAYNTSWYAPILTVQYSTDRVNWTDVPVQPTGITDSFKQFEVSGLTAGEYYLKFSGARVYVDNIIGWHKATPAPEHDLYIVSSTLPTTVAPGETDAFTAELKVTSLVAAEENITAKVSVGYSNNRWEVCTSEAQTIAVDGVTTYALTGTVPENLDDGDYELFVTFGDLPEVKLGTINIADRLTLSITDFKLADGQDATVQANQSNEFRADFSVTVQNTGSVGVLPYAYIYQGDVLVGYNDGDETLEPGQSKTITIAAENMSAGEGGEITFTAKARIFNLDDVDFAYATPVTLTVNAAAAKFSIAENGGNTLANGDALDFGLVKTATTKTLTITNNGTATLELSSLNNPTGFEIRTSDSDSELAPGESTEIEVTLLPNQGKVSANFAIDYVIDVANTQKTFNLTLTGRSVSEDTWTEAFNDYNAAIPVDWTNNGWSVAGEYNDYPGAAYTYTASATLMTPRLQAAEGEELTFNVVNNYYNTATYAYSSDKINWSEEVAITGTGEKSFIAPAAGNYYLRFTGSGAYLQNFVGFKLNPLAHDTEISASSVPTTGTQYADYTATVTLKENAGKAEEVIAKLYVGGEEKASVSETIIANDQTTLTLTWTPDATITEAVKAYVKVTYAGGDLTTDEVDLTIAAPYTLDENSTTTEATAGTYDALVLNRTFVEGWNTVCLPFTIDVTAIDANAVAFKFAGYNTDTKELTFEKVTTLTASYPYVIYVPAAISDAKVFKNVTISSTDNTGWHSSSNDVTFQGSYAKVDATTLSGNFGLTAAGKIVKASATATMKGFRAYFTGVPVGASARFIGFIDDELTGIRMITVDQNVEGVFNLQGQKIQQMKKGGLYIINGKKQVVK